MRRGNSSWWNGGPGRDAPEGAGDVVSWFEAQAARQPFVSAVIDGDERLSYAELDRRSGRLARRLRELGVRTESRVALRLGRGVEMPVAVLAVLKAGGVCVPLDPAYPPERIALMLEDARAVAVLTRREMEAEAAGGMLSPSPARPAGSLLYVIYTSGSTGRPKGVAMTHDAIANLVAWQLRDQPSGPPVTLQFAALSFDVSFQEMFTTWCAGGTLVLVPEELRRDAPGLLDRVAAAGVERLFLPVAALEQLAEAAAERESLPAGLARRLREVITAGEQLRVTPQVAAFFERLPGCALVNHYGPSETHVVTSLRLDGPPASWPALPAIGRPIDNARTVVLDAALGPVPPGVAGELYLGGRAVGRGYLDRPDATAERFLPDPFAEEPGARLYRSGDRARMHAGGIVEHLGRTDDQVKLRGFRIEPGEIEAALGAHPAVREAAVALRDGPEPGSRRLVAWVVPREVAGDLVPALRVHLAARLPAWMVPSAFEILNALPLTPSGKVDRRALPAPGGSGPSAPARPPCTPVERALAAIWCEVLGLPEVGAVGINDDFFALGGHSLLATRVLSRLRRSLGVDLPLAEMFSGPTIAHLAAAVERARSGAPSGRPSKITALSRQERRLVPVPEEPA